MHSGYICFQRQSGWVLTEILTREDARLQAPGEGNQDFSHLAPYKCIDYDANINVSENKQVWTNVC